MFNLCYTPSNCNITENKKTCMLLIHASLDARAQMADNSRRRYKQKQKSETSQAVFRSSAFAIPGQFD